MAAAEARKTVLVEIAKDCVVAFEGEVELILKSQIAVEEIVVLTAVKNFNQKLNSEFGNFMFLFFVVDYFHGQLLYILTNTPNAVNCWRMVFWE